MQVQRVADGRYFSFQDGGACFKDSPFFLIKELKKHGYSDWQDVEKICTRHNEAIRQGLIGEGDLVRLCVVVHVSVRVVVKFIIEFGICDRIIKRIIEVYVLDTCSGFSECADQC